MPPNAPTGQYLERPSIQGNRLWSGLSVISKRSFRSFATSAFEADDERSSGDDSMDSSGFNDERRQLPAPLYTGQDSRPTSRKELLGWYAYAFAAETYIICGIGELHLSLEIGSLTILSLLSLVALRALSI